ITVASKLRDIGVAEKWSFLVRGLSYIRSGRCECRHIDVGLADFMPAHIAYVCGLDKDTERHLSLYAQAILHHARNHEIGIDCAETENRCGYSGATRRVGYVSILECHVLKKRNNASLAEDNIALGLVIENSKAAADYRSIIMERRIGKAETRS